MSSGEVVLVYPKTGMDAKTINAPPHALLSVAAPLDKAGYKVKVIDQRVDPLWSLSLSLSLAREPLFVGISTMTGTQVKNAIEIAKLVRKQTDGKIPIVWGGAHPTLLYEQVLKSGYADVVAVGESDNIIVDLASALADKESLLRVMGVAFNIGDCVIKTLPPDLADLNTLLSTPWHLVDVEKYIHPDMYIKNSPRTLDIGQTSRGCPKNCGFCSSASIRGRKWRAFSAERAIDMITETVKRFNLTGIWLRDDEFYIDRGRASMIAEGILPLNIRWYTSGTRVDVFNKTSENQVELYRKSGAHTLKFGAESGSNKILKLMNKGITKEETLEANRKAKRHNIIPAFALMMGFPTETFAEINETIDMAKQIRSENPQAQFETMAVYTALPGTPMWDMAIEHGLKPPTKLEEWGDWNFDEYDPKGKRIPWFNARERQAIGNLCYISMLSNAATNAIGSLEDGSLKRMMQIAYSLPHKYYQWRFFGKHYHYTGELNIVRALRQRIFYNNNHRASR